MSLETCSRFVARFAASLLTCAAPAAAQAPTAAPPNAPPAAKEWPDWLRPERTWLSARLRYEDVDQDGFSKRAEALTLRTVLGVQTAAWRGWSGTLELEDVVPLFDEHFDSGTNGHTQFPLVADPEGAEINQAFLEQSREKRWDVRIGRQRLVLDNARFVGNSGWRQNEQTFDAVKLCALDFGGVEATYVYVDNVNRTAGDDSPVGNMASRTSLVHLARDVGAVGRLTAYAYLLDSDRFPTTSTDTFGARLAGKRAFGATWGALWTAELATQRDAGSNPNDVDQEYACGELGASWRDVTLLAGYELLGGSGQPGDAFQTPLATLHQFQGWADKFLVTPNDGIEDAYVSLEAKVRKAKLQAVWHEFRADRGDDRYGTEVDVMVSVPVRAELSVGAALASYDADRFATDTTKGWVWVAVTL